MQDTNNDGLMAIIKSTVIWVGAIVGSITLNQLVLGATLIFTGLQIYILVRDKIINNPSKRGEQP